MKSCLFWRIKMSNNKLGSYIVKLMSTIRENEDDFIKNLALSELSGLRDTLSEFIVTNTIKTDEFPEEEKTEKQLLNEEKKNGK